MKLKELENFIAVAATGSIRAAARMQGLTPPALTQSIAKLEEELHVPLVIRTTRGAVLSEYGIAFLHRARLITGEVEKAQVEMAHMLGKRSGLVTIGSSMTPAITILPAATVRFRQQMPEVRLNIVGGIYHQHLAPLRSGEMDFAIGPIPSSGLDGDFDVEPLFTNDLAVVAHRTNPLVQARSLTDLVDAEWIITGPLTQGPGATLADAFRAHGLSAPRAMIQCDSILILQTLLATTRMICVLPRQLLGQLPWLHTVTAIEVTEALPSNPICLFRRPDIPLLPAAAHLATLLRREAHYFVQAGNPA
ncbi:LysR substrate-binding domain-containing protein [uncultured Pseudacidovorax sp.]|uniref:LysR substrate-binding domain-containing protein n=1 Tax=uncultured Pseudacidovorax sp. TaxID=679313 RepID=UPI0025E16300|nr:LysR substrate-binding domain-containing protein [uncultured Pseudacidovorax sp.]